MFLVRATVTTYHFVRVIGDPREGSWQSNWCR